MLGNRLPYNQDYLERKRQIFERWTSSRSNRKNLENRTLKSTGQGWKQARHLSPHICIAGRRCSKAGERDPQQQQVCTSRDFFPISGLIWGLQSHHVSSIHSTLLTGRSGASLGASLYPGWLIVCSSLHIYGAEVCRHHSGCSQHPSFPQNQLVRLSAWPKHPDQCTGAELASAGPTPANRRAGTGLNIPDPNTSP